jgi:hypothetical protein
MYLTQGQIAADADMNTRVAQAAAQEGVTDAHIDPDVWTNEWRRVWSAAPGWSDAWESALAGNNENPGADPAVITDGQILSQVQGMKPFSRPTMP